jgi:hypothetical protein
VVGGEEVEIKLYFYKNCMGMVVEIKKKYSEKKKRALLEKVQKVAKKGPSLKDVFGILKDGLDGLEYQKKVRSEWD